MTAHELLTIQLLILY